MIRREIWGSKHVRSDRPYLVKYTLTPKTPWGQLFLHVFHRPDADPDLHDHPWDFWTFPLNKRGYYEEYLYKVERREILTSSRFMGGEETWERKRRKPGERIIRVQQVRGHKWHFRPAEHAHRVLYPAEAYGGFNTWVDTHHSIISQARVKQARWPIRTLVWAKRTRCKWGFWVDFTRLINLHMPRNDSTMDGWYKIHWRDYVERDRP